MLGFLARRLVLLIPVVLGTITLTFMLMHMTPGDPARTYLGPHATPDALAALRHQWGLDQPIWAQYWRFLSGLAVGDLGQSMVFHDNISTLLATHLPPTLMLMGLSALMSDVTMTAGPGRRRRHVRTGDRKLIAGGAILGVIVLMAAFAPLLTRYDPVTQDFMATMQGPSLAHLMGTDNIGRDIWSRILFGTRADLFLASVAVLAPLVVGMLIGALSGYFGGLLDTVVMRVADVVVAFPFYVLVISLVFILGNGIGSIFVAISIVSWVAYDPPSCAAFMRPVIAISTTPVAKAAQ